MITPSAAPETTIEPELAPSSAPATSGAYAVFVAPSYSVLPRLTIGEMQRQGVRLIIYTLALVIAFWGNNLMVALPPGSRFGLPDVQFNVGLPYLLFALALILVAEFALSLTNRSRELIERMPERVPMETRLVSVRVLTFIPAVAFAAGAFLFNSGNRFTTFGVVCWGLSILLMALAFTPHAWQPLDSLRERLQALGNFPRQETATFFAVLLIMALASYTRLLHIDRMLPEMTSDHVEKLLDAQSVADGQWRVFMENNGGREPMQFYLLALIDQIPLIQLDFMALKLLAALEAIITIPVFFWLGRTIIGTRDERLAVLVGISFALVAAVAYWHIGVARVALRIILTPLFVSLVLIYFIRGMRCNQRADFIKAGLALGIGLYTYQAIRMLPVLLIVGFVLVLLFNLRHWRALRTYFFNFVVLVIIAFTVFLPLFRYSIDYPESFWSRTSGRFFGEDRIESTNELGQTVIEFVPFAQRLRVFQENIGILENNIVRALQMFNYRGDRIFLHNAPTYPHLDPLLSAFLVVGFGGWLVWMFRRRDPADWLIILGVLIMLLPSALAIAQPMENPSATRASGAMPMVLFLTAFGVATVYHAASAFLTRRMLVRRAVTLGASAVLVMGAWNHTAWVLFQPYRTIYFQSWHPIHEGGSIMRGAAESGGAYGNTFILSFRYWWDYRAVAIEAGLKPNAWTNGDISLPDLPRRMWDAYNGNNRFPLDASRDLLFFYHQDDLAADEQFRLWFPQGYSTLIEVMLPDIDDPLSLTGERFPDKDFKVYRVPAPGDEALRGFFAANGLQ